MRDPIPQSMAGRAAIVGGDEDTDGAPTWKSFLIKRAKPLILRERLEWMGAGF